MSFGIFTISLDFELHWGVFDKRDRMQRKSCYLNTRDLIRPLLEKFSTQDIGVTWATVGALFVKDEEEWEQNQPAVLPAYANQKYSPYLFAEKEGIGAANAWAHFAPELVQLIPQFEKQELATHSFSHYYCQEAGQDIHAFKADLQQVQKLALEKTGQLLTSLVFPRNQYNEEYLKACFDAGITVIRSNPNAWYWSGIGNDDTSLLRKVFRTGDVLFPMGSRTTYKLSSLKAEPGLPLSLPASRLLRQYDPSNKMLNTIRLKRILSEMQYAAKNKECYHLWWHPENFGYNPKECMEELDIILQHYRQLKNKFGMQSWMMKEYAASVQ